MSQELPSLSSLKEGTVNMERCIARLTISPLKSGRDAFVSNFRVYVAIQCSLNITIPLEMSNILRTYV